MVSVPTPVIVAVWPAANEPATPATVNWVTVSGSTSTSLSLASTLPETGVSSGVLPTSATTCGASLAPVTVMDKVVVAVPPWPSLTV